MGFKFYGNLQYYDIVRSAALDRNVTSIQGWRLKKRVIIFVSKRGHLYNRLLYNSERMSEYEVVHFLQNSDSMLQNPDSFEPEELAQYFASYASYGVHDSITTLL